MNLIFTVSFASLALCCCASIEQIDGPLKQPSPPVWPSSYEMQYTIELPYVQTVQIVGLKIPVHVWLDGSSERLRMDVYGGLDSTYVLSDFTYNTFPRIMKKACMKIDTTTGPTLRSEEESKKPLPDISGWEYSGAAKMPGGALAFVWSVSQSNGEKTNQYMFYTSQATGHPIKLVMAGLNLLSGSHFDEYIVDFVLFNDRFSAGSGAIFKPPSVCNHPIDLKSIHQLGPIQYLSLLPSSLSGSMSKVDSTLHLTTVAAVLQQEGINDNLGSVSENALTHLKANSQFVAEWNSQHANTQGFTLAVNRFAAMPHAQFLTTSLGHKPFSRHSSPNLLSQRLKLGGGGHLGVFQRKLRNEDLPKNVDYRGTGADGLVKDQAFCGSCWAFATTGTMTGTWFKATGQILSLSEQQIVDCSWDHDVNGCWGGEGEAAMDFVVEAGGAVMEDDYAYVGVNGYCKSNQTAKVAFFSGYESIASGDEGALMEALATRGPLYVALDAGQPTFKFYSEGIYHSDACNTDRENLNHAVTLVGYGTSDQGVDYWLIRNSWSKLWGDDGYITITRNGNDCGITTGAVQAVVDESAVKRLRGVDARRHAM